MTLRDFAYGTLMLGKPIVVWLGLLAMAMLVTAASIMLLNNYAKARIPVKWHHFFALGGLAVAIVHMILALTAYI